jgi:hypothetical protein
LLEKFNGAGILSARRRKTLSFLAGGYTRTKFLQYKKGRAPLGKLYVHPRVHERHPELLDRDVIAAWETALLSTPRTEKNPNEYLAVGFDGRGRLLEMVAVRLDGCDWLIYHAMTPPSNKTFEELGIERRSRGIQN